MDLDALKHLIGLMNDHGLTRLEVMEDGRHYRLEKGGAMLSSAMPQMVAAPQGLPFPALGSAGAPLVASKPDNTVTFNSPMVGTFYRAAGPDAVTYVNQGDRVSPDTVLCVIEAMKVFNEIKAETRGTILEVLAENAEAVEYGQPLFLIRPE